MNGLRQKFIITKDNFQLGRVVFHRDLNPKAIAGGYWFWDQKEDILYLYGASSDFGWATREQIDAVMDKIKDGHFKDSKIVFEPYSTPARSLVEVMADHIDQYRAIDLIEANSFV